MSWIKEVLLQHKEFEAPLPFVYWSALAAISAVVKDNVWIDRFIFKQYPNIYVMLHADSGVKKGPPISMAKKLVSLAIGDDNIISGRSSIQGILKRMGSSESIPGGKIKHYTTAFICSSELTSSIVEDKVATTILTDLYDRNYNEEEWKSLLKMENFSIAKPTIIMLTGTNEAHAGEFFLGKDVHGGFFARTFIIHEKTSEIVNSLIKPPEIIPDYPKLACYLKELAKLRGPFESLWDLEGKTFTPVGRYYDEWYREFKRSIKGQDDPTGTLGRFGESVIKVAMLVSLAETPELRITRTAMEQAIGQCEKLVGNVRRTTLGRGNSFAAERALVIEELALLRDNHKITREQLVKKYWMRASAKEWDDICDTLIAGGHIVRENEGNVIVYRMLDTVAREWGKHFKGKK